MGLREVTAGPRRRSGAPRSQRLQAAFVTAAAGERITKGPHQQKALFMLNLALALSSLSPHGAGDKNLCGLRADFCLEVSTLTDSRSECRDLLSLQRGTIKH